MNIQSIWLIIVLAALTSGITSSAEPDKPISGKIVPGVFTVGTNGAYYVETNIEALWPGTWRQDTNGWRVQLYCWNTNNRDTWVSVGIGNIATNLNGYVWTPNERFSTFELTDSNGIIIPPKSGVTLSERFPAKMPVSAFPLWSDGKLKNRMGFFTNSPPWVLKQFCFRDIYQIKSEGDYTLTACVAIYKTRANAEHYFNRIDLPCVSIKIHLKP